MTHALHVTTWHPWIEGLAGLFILEQCAAIRRSGVDVGLIFSRIEGLSCLSPARLPRGFPGVVQTDDPVPTWGFKTWNVPGGASLVPRVVDLTLRSRYAAYEAARGRPDILHAHGALDAGPATRKIARAVGVGYVITEHSSGILNAGLSSAGLDTARQIYTDARHVIAVSNILASRILDICPEARVRVIPNMVPGTVFALRTSARARDDSLKVFALSNLLPSKCVHNTIEALAGVSATFRNRVVLHVIGDGVERPRLEELARLRGLRTVFHGYLPHIEAMRLLAAADLLVHASAYETFGIVLAEAAALGVPVVATRCGGPQDVVGENSGLLVEVDDVAALRTGVDAVLGNLEYWRAQSDKISRCAYDRFHESRVAAAIADTYR